MLRRIVASSLRYRFIVVVIQTVVPDVVVQVESGLFRQIVHVIVHCEPVFKHMSLSPLFVQKIEYRVLFRRQVENPYAPDARVEVLLEPLLFFAEPDLAVPDLVPDLAPDLDDAVDPFAAGFLAAALTAGLGGTSAG